MGISKQLVTAILVVGLFFLGLQMFQDSQVDEESRERSKKLVEIKGSRIVGYHNKQKSWEIDATYIWAGRNRHLFRAEQVLNGALFNRSGEVVIEDIHADKLKANSKSKTLVAEGHVQVRYIRSSAKSDQKGIDIRADELRYFNLSQKSYLKGNVVVKEPEITIFTEALSLDHDKNLGSVNSVYTLITESFEVTGNQLSMDIDEEVVVLSGGVRGIHHPETVPDPEQDERENLLRSETASLVCNELVFESKPDADWIRLKGGVQIDQGSRRISGETAVYNKTDGKFEVDGGVEIWASDGHWLLRDHQIQQFQNPDVIASLDKPLEVTAKKCRFDADNRVLDLLIDVVLKQDDKTIKCQRLTFDDQAGIVTLRGSVHVQKDDADDIKADTIVVDINEELFQVEDRVEAEFFLKKDKSN